MLTVLQISNIALIDDLQVEFERGLNLLTGETGSGKSIIVDALGILIGGRFASDMVKAGEKRAFIEGLFSVERNTELEELLQAAGIELTEDAERNEIIIRREMNAGRSKIFINNQLATLALLRDLHPFLVDIHGQGDQQTLFNPDTHLELLDAYANSAMLKQEVASRYKNWLGIKRELDNLRQDEAKKFQLIDILKFQIDELERASLEAGEDERLEEERRRLNNVEKLTALAAEAYGLTYEDDDSALSRIVQATRRIEELSEYDSNFRSYQEGLQNARAVLEDLSYTLRDFTDGLEFSPERLAEVENRLAELSRLKRKYGGTIESALEHRRASEERLKNIEHADERERELQSELTAAQKRYLQTAQQLHRARVKAAKDFEKSVVQNLSEVAMENARFEVHIATPTDEDLQDENASRNFTAQGIDRVEFYFSANIGEDVRPLARVASGGEASRLMLVLKTVAGASEFPRTIVFDEVDTGIGGRVSEAVGAKLKRLSASNQVLCVTHQPQVARFADAHLLVKKEVIANRTTINLERLNKQGRIEELARMIAGSEITDAARRHAKEMLKS